MKAIAPGKLILSGEHAVVYGRPALAMAIDRCAESMVTADASDTVSFHLVDLQQSHTYTLHALDDLKRRLRKDYRRFLDGTLGVREILHTPIELFAFAFITAVDTLHLDLTGGLRISTHSSIPIGCGLGSSAATVLSALRALAQHLRVDPAPDGYLTCSLEAEKLQHGHASGVDSWLSLHGGCALFRDGSARRVPLPRVPMYLVHTGVPATTTGECVVAVRKQFQHDPIWHDFETVTQSLEQALRANDLPGVQRSVRENHRLLTRIGVVPARVHALIAEIEQQGGAAKICGAGAVAGEHGGIVLVFAEQPPVEICANRGCTLLAERGDPLGVRIV